MRPRARPFMVEIKSSKRATQPASAASFSRLDDWGDLIPPDDLPARDVHQDLIDGPPSSEARREAEKLFNRFAGDQQPVPTSDDPEAPVSANPEALAPAVRVLPDLLAAAREEERIAIAT